MCVCVCVRRVWAVGGIVCVCEESVGRWVGLCVCEESVGRWVGLCVRRVWVGE